jgi:hypothetical protein
MWSPPDLPLLEFMLPRYTLEELTATQLDEAQQVTAGLKFIPVHRKSSSQDYAAEVQQGHAGDPVLAPRLLERHPLQPISHRHSISRIR